MPVINISRDTEIATQARRADTFVKRLCGLLGKSGLHGGEALWISPCKGVHTIGMRFPIDVIFLDKSHEVVETISAMRPYAVTKIYFKADSVLELEAGTIEKSRTRVGDKLEIPVADA